MDHSELDVETEPSALLEREAKEKRVLAVLLDRYLAAADKLVVQKTEMGGTEAYVGSVSLEWFAHRVRFANQLPLFRQKIDPDTLRVTIDAATLSEIQQRPLDWSRQAVLVQYLAARRVHKFPPVLVVMNRDWVDNPKSDEWSRERKAVRSVSEFVTLDNEGKVGLLDLSEAVTLFALDGQHRLMGVKGLMELLNNGMVARKNRDGKVSGEALTIEGIEKDYEIPHSYIQNLGKERIGIEFISAVVGGETREEARRRVRSIFVHVNRMANPLTAGQLAQLDEDDGFSIVARKAAVDHDLLKDKPGRDPRVNWDKSNISPKSTVLTTLQTLKEMTERYLKYKFPKWKPEEKNLVPLRPSEAELDAGLKDVEDLLDHMAKLPSYEEMNGGTSTIELRNFEKEEGRGHALFRPVGQAALAQALGVLTFKDGNSLDKIFEKLNRFDKKGGFKLDKTDSIFYRVLYDPGKEKMLSGRDLAAHMLQYLLGGVTDPDELEQLRLELAKARQTKEGVAEDFNGKSVELDDIKLPPVL
jgi:DGQHR domain-containing protein